MPVGLHGENLVFLASQPRAGSTLTQRMLAAHPEVHTVSEPWLMLHPFYALREQGIECEYIHRHARTALKNFLDQAGGAEPFYEGLRRMYGYLYGQSLSAAGKRVFLDKTPRYYLILPELVRTFPAARFILLIRNPLAVLCSMVMAWAPDGKLFHLERWKRDLFEAPRLMLEAMPLIEGRGAVLRYEELLADPELQLRRLCDQIGLAFADPMIEYGSQELPTWKFGDAEGVYRQNRPEAAHAQKWLATIADPQMWRIASEYLDRLGPDTMTRLGYDPDHWRRQLDKRRPRWLRRRLTFSLAYLCEPAPGRRLKWKRRLIWFVRQLRQRGPLHAVRWSITVAVKRLWAASPTKPETTA